MKFVIIDDDFNMGEIVLRDFDNIDYVNINYRDKLYRSHALNFLFRSHFYYRFNAKIDLPFQKIWYRRLTKNEFKNDDEICFVFLSGWYSKQLSSWISKKYPNSKQVLVFRDTVSVMKAVIPSLEKDKLRTIFDLILTYNPQDAEKYGFTYTPMFVSKIEKDKLPVFPKTDVVFIGAAKDRLKLLHSLYEKLSNYNLECDFHITSVENSDRKYPENIMYSDKYMKYLDYLGREASSECLIEIIKGDSQGNTYRSWEAVYYNKKLITNWKGIFSFPFYDPKFMLYIESEDDIDEKFFHENTVVNYNYKNENSPLNLLSLIQNSLE